MHAILQKFYQAEEDFLTAASTDNQLLVDFAERWQTLQSDWESCVHEVDHDTQQVVARIVAKVQELAGDIYTVESQTMSLKDDLLAGIEDIFMSLSLEDNLQSDPESGDANNSPSRDHCAVSPAEWLLNNLHNPYPPPHIHFCNGQASGSKFAKDWFAKARQRIGWTRLLRDRFAGCRSLAIEAAFRAFVRDDPHNPLSTDMKTAFSAIKAHAELVYGDEDTTSHPSPKRTRSISPTPSLTFSGSEDTDDEWPSSATFSRPPKRASSEIPGSPSLKRRRTHKYPHSSSVRITDTLPLTCTEMSQTHPRKRRLSEGDSDFSRPKRPRRMEGGRFYAVSDPLSPSAKPAWFDPDRSFQIPDSASTDPLEMLSFDLDFFDLPSIPSDLVSSTPASGDVAKSTDDFSTLFEIPQLDLLQSTLPSFNPDWTEFLNFESYLSPFPPSPSLTSSLTSTPSLIDDPTLSPSFPFYNDPFNPDPLLDILPHTGDKGAQLPPAGEPVIQGQDFLLSPGENARISPASILTSVH